METKKKPHSALMVYSDGRKGVRQYGNAVSIANGCMVVNVPGKYDVRLLMAYKPLKDGYIDFNITCDGKSILKENERRKAKRGIAQAIIIDTTAYLKQGARLDYIVDSLMIDVINSSLSAQLIRECVSW